MTQFTGNENATLNNGGFFQTTLTKIATWVIGTYQGFTQSGTGAIARSVQSKLGEVVSVLDFGAVGNGSTDDTLAIQAALNSLSVTGGTVFFPRAYYLITATLNVPASVTVLGESQDGSTIVCSNLTQNILSFPANGGSLRNIALGYAGTPTAGVALDISGSNFVADNFFINNCFVGIQCTGVAQFFTNFQIFNYVSIGIYVTTTNDVYFNTFILNAGNATNGALGGIRLQNKAEAILFSNGDILLGVYSMTTDAAAYAIGARPAYCNFTNVFFDSATDSCVSLNNIVETEFVGCWFSGGRSSTGYAGCSIYVTDSLRFTNSRFFNCGAQGCLVNNTAYHTHFINCSFESNSVQVPVAANGLHFIPGTQHFLVIGCKAHNGLYSGTQGYGVFIDTDCDFYRIEHNDLIGNITGAMVDGSATTATDGRVGGNIGYITKASGSSNIAVGQTVATITHGLAATPNPQDIYVTITTSPGSSGVSTLWITAITGTTFQIVSNAAVVTQALGVAWTARIQGD